MKHTVRVTYTATFHSFWDVEAPDEKTANVRVAKRADEKVDALINDWLRASRNECVSYDIVEVEVRKPETEKAA